MQGLKAEFNNQQVFLEIKHRKLEIKNAELKIPLTEIVSLKTKNEEESFFLMIVTKLTDNPKIILKFANYNVRDLCKSLILSSINDSGIYKEIDYDTSKFITSLSAPLLTIFSDMNCTVSQFYNHFMQSNFYDVRNKPTFLDRLITEKLREDFLDNSNNPSLTRINNYSLLMINEDTVSKPLTYTTKEIAFEPIYDVQQDTVEEDDTLDLEIEDSVSEIKIDKKELKKIIEISKKIYRGEEIDSECKEFIDKYRDNKYLKRLIIKIEEIKIC
ncbi:uncharacterized protein VNE69_04172 [Vairimorpha necatrix]|uniref:Uncharacterized protein n=1 Tax=Vairimorpha necatrix TaxID=6039 RepID=A0AAX4JBL0_9MICR